MLKYKYESMFYRFITSNQKEIVVDDKNADWHLFQLGNDLSMTKANFEQKKNRNFIEWMLPASLSTYNTNDYNHTETDLYIAALSSFIHYLEKQEKSLKIEQENIRTVIDNIDQRIKEAVDESVKARHNVQRMKLITDFNRSSHLLIQFVKEMMTTKIRIEDDTVSVYSPDEDLIQFMSKELTANGRKMQVVTEEVGNRW